MKKTLFLFLLFLCSSVYAFDVTSVKSSVFHEDLEFPCYGKAVAVSKDVVLTVRHVIEPEHPLQFRANSVLFKGMWLEAVNIGEDQINDLVLLKVKGAKFDPVELLSIPIIEVHGSPGREEVNKIKSRVATLQSFLSKVDTIKSLPEYQLASGMSGSPATADGRLIGIVSIARQKPGGEVELILVGPTPINNLLEKFLKLEEEK